MKGYFSTDGGLTGKYVRASSISYRLIREISEALSLMGMQASYAKSKNRLTTKNGKWVPAVNKTMNHYLSLDAGTEIRKFRDMIGFAHSVKTKRLNELCDRPCNARGPYRPGFKKVVSIKQVKSEKYVYDLCVPGPQNFLADGVLAHNTDIFNGKTISRYDNTKKSIRMTYRTKFENAGLDWSKIAKEEYYEVIKMNMLSFIEMEEYLSRANRLKDYWVKRLPRPRDVEKETRPEVFDDWLKQQRYSEGDLAKMNFDDKLDCCKVIAILQHGQYERFIEEFMETTQPDEIKLVLGEDCAAKLPTKKITYEQFDQARVAYNMSLLGMDAAQPRTKEEHFAPVIQINRRADIGTDDEPVKRMDTESMDLVYGGKHG